MAEKDGHEDGQIAPIDAEFLAILFYEDELGTVIRAHIFIEEQVNALLDGLLTSPEKLPRLHFEQRVRLLVALGVSEEISGPLIGLGKIRNAFAHRVDTKLTPATIADWLSSFPEDDRRIINEAHDQAIAALGQPMVNAEDNEQKAKFRLMAAYLRRTLKRAQAELDRKRGAARASR